MNNFINNNINFYLLSSKKRKLIFHQSKKRSKRPNDHTISLLANSFGKGQNATQNTISVFTANSHNFTFKTSLALTNRFTGSKVRAKKVIIILNRKREREKAFVNI
jgi:hypothetical protein